MLTNYKDGAYKIANLVIETGNSLASNGEAILVFLHKSVDGDCIGSATALASIFRKLGASAYVAMTEKLPLNMEFLDVEDLLFYPEESFINDKSINGTIVSKAMSVDCTESHRMAAHLGELYDSFEDNFTVDHHEVTHLENQYKWIMPQASSACEMVYYVACAVADIKGVDISEIIDARTAMGLLAGITTDTGRFTYSNTKAETLETAGVLMNLGGRIGDICYNLFDRKVKSEFLMSNSISCSAEFFFEDKLAVAIATREDFERMDADDDSIADVVSKLRDVDGVIISVVLRETSDGNIRGNLRSKGDFDCNKLASNFGGGGHKNASGFTVKAEEGKSINQIKNEVIDIVKELL